MESLCGNESFWNASAAWDGEWPYVSRCFQNTVLAWTPCCVLCVTALAYIPWIKYRREEALPYNWLFWAKQMSGVLLLTLEAMGLLYVVAEGFNDEEGLNAMSDLIAPGVRILATILVLAVVAAERHAGVRASTVLFLYWLVVVIADVVPFYTILLEQGLTQHLVTSVIFYVTFALKLCQLGLHCVAHVTSAHQHITSPETTASFPSWITYSWISRLMSRGFREELQERDVFELKPSDTSSANGPVLIKSWRREQKAERRALQGKSTSLHYDSNETLRSNFSEKTPLLAAIHLNKNCSWITRASSEATEKGKSSSTEEARKDYGARCRKRESKPEADRSGERPASLWRALVRTYVWTALLGNIWKLPHDLLAVLNPLLLGEMIDLNDDDSKPAWRMFVVATAIGISLVLQALLFHLTFHLSMTLGLRVKAALTAAVFSKVTTMSNESQKFPQGEIINLASVDTQHVNVFVSYLPYAWSGPVQIALSLYFLYRTVGPPAFAGAGVLVVLLPANAWLLARLGAFQGVFMESKDSRLKLVSELLTAIKAVKVNSWEETFESHVAEVRERELRVLKKVALLDASQTVMWALTPFAMSVLTLAVHALVGEDHRVTSEEAFVTLAYLSILRGVVTVAPMVMTDIIKAGVSVKRIERFLCHEDLDPSIYKQDLSQDAVVVFDNATFTRKAGGDPCLKNITLRLAEGSLVAVVGAVGSGKSSLLLSILGELHLETGHTPASYLPQHPWLRQATIRDNIVGHHAPFHKTHYDVTLRTCCLTSDLQAMAAGDLTEVGDKGVTLSGGQRQRVSLARVVYESRDLYLLDDPISSLDRRVGQQIFRQLIGQEGLLRDSTRLVVTSTYDWLPEADAILVLADGCVVEEGSYQSLLARGGLFSSLVEARTARDVFTSHAESWNPHTFRSTHNSSNTHSLWRDEEQSSGDKNGRRSINVSSATSSIHRESSTLLTEINALEVESDLLKAESGGRATMLVTSQPPTPSCLPTEVDSSNTPTVAVVSMSDETSDGLHEQLMRETRCVCISSSQEGASCCCEDQSSTSHAESDHCSRQTTKGEVTDMFAAVASGFSDFPANSQGPPSWHSDISLTATLASPSGQHSFPDALTSMSCEPLTKGHLPHHSVVCEERVQVGKVPWRIYCAIVHGLGRHYSVAMITLYVLYHTASVGANVWLSQWTDNKQLNNLTLLPAHSQDRYVKNTVYLGVYGALGFAQCVLVTAYAFLLAFRRVHASRDIHASLMRSVLHAPITFFHQNPPARMLNRMSRDLEVVDTDIWLSLEVSLDSLCHVLSTCVVIVVAIPYFLLVLLPAAAVYYFVQRYYVATSRQLRRLEAKTRSPVFAHLTDVASGAVVLRSAGASEIKHTLQEAARLVDCNLKLAFAGNTASRWLGVRMVALGVTIVGVASSLSVVFRRTLTSGVVGLTISYALDVTENLNWLVRMTGDLETDAASIERIDEYSRLASEDNSHCTLQPAPCWPLFGRIQYLNVTASHSLLTPPVLRDLNFTIQPGEKVGLVGRTGAGKTSLWSVMIGLLKPTDGVVVIDGLDVCTVPIHVLRSRVAVLPQEPFVLEGSIRLNLDPTGQINDEQMWEALCKVRLAKHIRSLPNGLDTQCQSDGSIFSIGQKQLLCLARLLLRPAKIVILDEATSSLDAKTAAVIEQTLIHACAKHTVLVVAHRLSTILNCSRVIVLDKGSVVEMDTPARLMANPLSFFSRLAASSGLMNSQSLHPRQLIAP